MKLLGLSGSLRKGSVHTALLEAARRNLPDGVELSLASIDLPLYNEDIDNTVSEANSSPDSVTRFKQQVEEANGLIFSSPEYNHSVSGPLKNAIDWASRPAFESPLRGKSVAIISASPSPVGGARGQTHLRSILASALSHVFPAQEYVLGSAFDKINSDSDLNDKDAERRLRRFIEQFTEYTKRLNT